MGKSPKMRGYFISAAASAWVAVIVMALSDDNQSRHFSAMLFGMAGTLVLMGIAVGIRSRLSTQKEQVRSSEKKFIDIKQKYMKNTSFVAIDFEHLYPSHETACEVGAVKVIDGLIVGRFYSTIKPPQEKCTGRINSDIIGLTEEMLETSPTFKEVYRMLCLFVGDIPLVAHHASTEIHVLQKCTSYYNMSEELLKNGMTDTCTMAGGRKLDVCCEEFDITLEEHHHPLQDAEATARLYLALLGEKEQMVVRGDRMKTATFSKYKEEHETFDHSILQPLSDDEVENKNTPFFGQVKTVVSGQFESYPDRNALKASLKALGADIDGTISKNTKLFVVGKTGVGPSKMKRALEYGTRIIQEEELYQWVEKQI
jgi:DNA polymerase III epsilon subunit-like protein